MKRALLQRDVEVAIISHFVTSKFDKVLCVIIFN